MVVTSEPWYVSPHTWETFVTGATSEDLGALHDSLPQNDLGRYRMVCLEVIQGRFEHALIFLEEGGEFFEKEGYATGLHAFVRQRLGLKLGFKSPSQSSDVHSKEDTLYWFIAWALHDAGHQELHAARGLLTKAKSLALELDMVQTLTLIETITKQLHTPQFGLPLVAPPHRVLASPKAFDDLRQDKNAFARLVALGSEQGDKVQLCRYAQYLLYEQQYEQALVVIEKASPSTYPLAYSVKMAIVASLEWFELLHDMVEMFKHGSSQPLEAEATMLGYETCAFYFAVVRKDYQLGYAYLHRAEALALEHKLLYRLNVIRMHLEATANMAGDTLTLDPLSEANTGDLKHKSVRTRFDSFLRAGNIHAIEDSVKRGQLSVEEMYLARGTFEYQRFMRGEGGINLVAHAITDHEPEGSISKLLWSLLMLQLFNAVGEANGRANPERIYKAIEQAILQTEHLGSVVPVAAQIYPSGLAIASYLFPRLEAVRDKVATVWSDDTRDGLHLHGKKIVTITKPVREALILDDLHRTREHFEAVTRRRTGHTQNKVRLERSLGKVNLKLHEITTVGGVYRGLLRLGRDLGDSKVLQASETLRTSSSFLKENVYPELFTF
jgi:hypothetical protein